MEEMKQIVHFQFIDFVKGLAILLVVVGHLIQGNSSMNLMGGRFLLDFQLAIYVSHGVVLCMLRLPI